MEEGTLRGEIGGLKQCVLPRTDRVTILLSGRTEPVVQDTVEGGGVENQPVEGRKDRHRVEEAVGSDVTRVTRKLMGQGTGESTVILEW